MIFRPAVAHLIISGLLFTCMPGASAIDANPASAPRVQVVERTDGTFTLLRDGQPYQVKGAGIGAGRWFVEDGLELFAESGGNSIRTWGIEHLDQRFAGKTLLDRAHELGITVVAGFWVQHARHGFDYNNPASLERQRQRLREAVAKYRNHPALLAWGLGNEMEAFEPKVDGKVLWPEMNHLAGIIKELDPNHPVMSVIAGAGKSKIADIVQHYPNLDILGVNSYGNGALVGRNLIELGWTGPYMLTEFGVSGAWEVPMTSWNAPIEPDPSTKALDSYTAYKLDRDDNVGRSLGSYVFLWGHKQETTATWYGMLLPTGERLPRADAMAFAWTGEWPANRAPKLEALESPVALKSVKPGSRWYAEAQCIDREGDPLKYTWEIRAQSTDRRVGGDAETAPPSFPRAIKKGQGTPRIEFTAPDRPGGYRVFVSAYDGKGGAVVHNLPFFVED